MKKFLMGLIVGMGIMASGFTFADDGLEKVEAYLRPALPITLNGDPVTLESAPVMYDGSTYLKLRDVASLTNLDVNWNDSTQTVELGSKPEGEIPVTPVENTGTTNSSNIKVLTPEEKEQKIIEIDEAIKSINETVELNQNFLNGYRNTPGKENLIKGFEDAIAKNKKMIEDLEQQKADLEK